MVGSTCIVSLFFLELANDGFAINGDRELLVSQHVIVASSALLCCAMWKCRSAAHRPSIDHRSVEDAWLSRLLYDLDKSWCATEQSNVCGSTLPKPLRSLRGLRSRTFVSQSRLIHVRSLLIHNGKVSCLRCSQPIACYMAEMVYVVIKPAVFGLSFAYGCITDFGENRKRGLCKLSGGPDTVPP